MKSSYLTLACAAALSYANLTWAQESEGEPETASDALYFSVLAGYLFEVDEARNSATTKMDKGGGFTYIFGKQKPSGLGYEVPIFVEAFETGDQNGTDFYRYGAGVDVLYALSSRSKQTAFALVGIGATYNDVFPDDGDDYAFYANAGIGATSNQFSEFGIKLRAEVRYIYDAFDNGVNDGFSDLRAGFGLEFNLSREPVVVTETIETIKMVHVEKQVSMDADGDGVIDSHDQCPDTVAGTRVLGNGCPLTDVVALEGVTFESGSARLRPDARVILNDAGGILQRYPDMVVEIAGHTDSQGGDAYNQQLSQARAEAVRSYLVSIGIGAGRLTAVGYGESEPRASNDTAVGRELNRRVEMRIKN